jgi:DNA repair exonuclease SbcCD ATPase subunit
MTKIVTVSDIHWRGITRHEEYTVAFNNLFQQLREEVKPDYIFMLGDYFHTKTQGITPEVIEKITWMFGNLASIAPVYAILGNHDGNLTNEDRQDTISPIVAAIDNPRINLFKKSCNHQIEGTNINLGVLSCFDEPGWSYVQSDPNMINIGLFHGAVRGAKTDTDWVLSGGEIEISTLEQFDFAMLGDIHKRQFLGYRSHEGITRDMKPWIGYPGSLIQQNYGEEPTKGFLVWDIRGKGDWDVNFVAVPNSYQFHTVEWKGNARATISEAIKVSGGNLTNRRVRVSFGQQNISSLEKQELYLELKNAHKVSEVVFKSESNTTLSQTASEAKEKTSSLRNNPEAICELYESFLDKDYEGTLTEAQRKEGKAFVMEALKNSVANEDESPRDVVWSIKSLEFNNLYRYGSGNKVEFQKLNGITGVFGPNKIGKSAIMGALMFGLFNTTDRGSVKSSYVINKRKKSGFVRITINVSGVDYIIERTVTKASKRGGKVDEEKATTKLSISRVNKNGEKEEAHSENSESRTDTDKVIRKLIGTPQDFLLTAFSNQGGITRFIDEGATQRKAVLNRFLDLDIFEKIYKQANENLSGYKTKMSSFRNTNWSEAKAAYEQEISACNTDIQATKERLEKNKARGEQLQAWLQQNGAGKQDELKQKNAVVERLQGKINMRKVELAAHEQAYEAAQSKINTIAANMNGVDLSALEGKAAQLEKLSEEYYDLQIDLGAERTKLTNQKKNIKKLDVVPCGDTYPTCHYIKDAHDDRKTLEAQKKIVDSILATYETMKEDYEALQQEKIEQKIKDYRRWESEHNIATQQLRFTEKLLAGSTEAIQSLEQDLKVQTAERDILLRELSAQADISASVKEYEDLNAQNLLEQGYLHQLYMLIGKHTNQLELTAKQEEEASRIIEEQKVYDSVAQAFSKNGIPAYVLKNKLPEINTELQNILGGIVPFHITLETEPGSNSLDVMIEDNESRRVIELASGMEKMIASLAIRVALINLSSLPKLDMLMIDEGWGVLDANNVGKVLELIQSIKTRFKSMVIISHIDAVKEVADNMITICDNGTESNVNF